MCAVWSANSLQKQIIENSFHHRISISDLQQEIEKLTTERNQLAKELEETQMTNKEKVCMVHDMISCDYKL